MELFALVMIVSGVFLVQSAVVNRDPVKTLREIIAEPGKMRDILREGKGTWQTKDDADGGPVDPATPGTGGSTGFTGHPREKGYKNGQIPASALSPIPWAFGQKLWPSATASLIQLNEAYKARFGKNIAITDSYRSLAQQYVTKREKGELAAQPGTSNHGWGTALDLGGGINKFGSAEHLWMVANAPRFGWVLPTWAQQTGSKPEPWHFEFIGWSNENPGTGGGTGGGSGGGW